MNALRRLSCGTDGVTVRLGGTEVSLSATSTMSEVKSGASSEVKSGASSEATRKEGLVYRI